MDLTPRLQKRILAGGVAALAIIYTIVWLAPAIGAYHDDAVYLVSARALVAGHGYVIDSLPTPLPQTKYPPLLSALLALFLLVSDNAQWLKLVPMACAVGWFLLSIRLLRRMGASPGSAWLVVGLAAAAPGVVFLAGSLLSETLFGLLLTATLLLVLEERSIAAGLCAGAAMLTRTAAAPLIAACLLTLLLGKRFRSAAQFAATAAVVAIPWLIWSAMQVQDLTYGGVAYVALNAVTGLQASEKVAVIGNNFLSLLNSPAMLMTEMANVWIAIAMFALTIWCLYRRRQLVPDLFLFLYLLMLDLWAWPPFRFVAPILPLTLWVVWRAVRTVKSREMVVACVAILGGLTLFSTVRHIPDTLRYGQFFSGAQPPNDWKEMQKMFGWIRANTPPDAVIMANLDPLFYLYTGRKALRGFTFDPFRTFYTEGPGPVSAAELSSTLLKAHVTHVAISPDLQFGEAASYHKAVEALERGGLLEPVEGAGLGRGYRLLRATGAAALR